MPRYNNPDQDLRFDLLTYVIDRFSGQVDFAQLDVMFRYVLNGINGINVAENQAEVLLDNKNANPDKDEENAS